MLADGKLYASIAVNDLGVAKEFYGAKLGLTQKADFPGGISYENDNRELIVYESPTAGSGKATCAGWNVENIEAVVEELKGKGITFEQYDLPGTTFENGIHIMGPMKAAWFKDPDGNILGLSNQL